jgi:hypothetical protein
MNGVGRFFKRMRGAFLNRVQRLFGRPTSPYAAERIREGDLVWLDKNGMVRRCDPHPLSPSPSNGEGE